MFVEGDALYDAMVGDIGHAERSVRFESYILASDAQQREEFRQMVRQRKPILGPNRQAGDHAVSVDNETYQILWFDESGRAWPEAAPGCDRHGGAQWIPTEPERQRVSKMILRESGEPRRADDRHVWAKR